jgi:oligoendopeptidase F
MTDNTPQPTGAEEIAWNLGDLYSAIDDPTLTQHLDQADALADQLAAAYKGRIASLTPDELRVMLKQLEDIFELGYRVSSYAYLVWSTDTTDAARGALLQRVRERGSRLQQKLVFVELEWANAPDDAAKPLIEAVSDFRHWLEVTRLQRPYLLSEPEEKILTEKAVTGRGAWDRLFDETHAAQRYPWDGEQLPLQAVLTRLYDGDREVRRRAQQVVTDGLSQMLRTTTFIYNTLLADKASDDRLRGYKTWISARNLSNEVRDESVEALVNAVTSRYDIVARYYRLKARLLGLDELFDYDRYAPLPAADRRYGWSEARSIVLNAYAAFHPHLAEVAEYFFEKEWIDAPVRPGKSGGAYCMSGTPQTHPYVFLNYEAKPNDVMTLAHELGHGVHGYLARVQGILQAGTPLTTAETASVFGEMLVFQDLIARETDPNTRLAMLTAKLEDSFATVFRQIAMNRFEHAAHIARREQGELPSDQFKEFWLQTQRSMFQDSMTMTDNYGIWWSYVPHFMGTPGYVYAYAFGELLVLALYARYEQARDGFADGYLKMLSAGGSDWPHEIVKPLGIDLADPDFWSHGLNILDGMVRQAEELAEQIA